jgi:CHAT domain-containing protein/Tfp pilus assembly protein PilF
LERAVKAAAEAGLLRREAEARQSLAFVLLQTEEPDEALRQLDAALERPEDEQIVALMHSQRALLLMRLGRYDQALAESDTALESCAKAGLDIHLTHVHANRGIVFSYLGQFSRAEAELGRALALCESQGSQLGVAQVTHNLGFLAARRGDVPEALRLYDDALARYRKLGVATYVLFIDRCEVLMAANLLAEARRAAEQAVVGLEAAGLAADLAEGRLMLAEVALADRDYDVAKESADAAARAFARQRRAGWAAHAHYVSARASWALGAPDRTIMREAKSLATRLDEAGWRLQALEARIEAAKAAVRAGNPDEALRMLEQVGNRSGASADERVRAWYASAIARLAGGNRSGALRALEAGLRVAEQHRATFGATELRVRTAIQSAELADLGLELVLERGEPRSVLVWAERWRARSLWTPDALPPDDPELAQGLGELRQTIASLEQAVLSESEQREELEVRRARIEGDIRNRALRRTQTDRRHVPEPPTLRELQEVLEGRVLVEFVERGGELHAVVCTESAARVVRLGASASVERDRAGVQFAIARLALRRNAKSSLVASAQLLARATANLDAQLLRPLAAELQGTGEIVLVPTGELHALPWGLIPSLRGRAVSIAPSAGLWMSRAQAATSSGPVVLVGGPSVPFASEELAQLRALYPEAIVLDGDEAVGASVLQALRGAGVAHVAAHGRFRADNPLFSSLDLADGPLTVYDLEQLPEPAELMVLSACDAGRSQVHPGNELMGTTAALLSLGTRAIVASVAPVPDEGAADVMVRFHRRLKLGEVPAAALADAQSGLTVGDLDADELASGTERALRALAGGAFACFGAGGRRPGSGG